MPSIFKEEAERVAEVTWKESRGHHVNLQVQPEKQKNVPSLQFTWLNVNAVEADDEHKSKLISKLMYQRSLTSGKNFFLIWAVCITSTAVAHQNPANLISEHVQTTIIIPTFRLCWEYTKCMAN